MKLDDIGDPALVERIGKIVHKAFPPDDLPFGEWLEKSRADEQGAFQLSLYALDVLDENDVTDDEKRDIDRFNQLVTLALDIIDLQGEGRAAYGWRRGDAT